MAFIRRYGRRLRRRFRRRSSGVFRPRYRQYLRKKRRVLGRRKRGGTVSKLLKSLLPVVPIKYIEAVSDTGQIGSRTWWSKCVGSVTDAYNYRNFLPGGSNIYDDGTTGTSTHLTFQQFYAKKWKMRHQMTLTGQNVANTTMILTCHICKFRRDWDVSTNPGIVAHFFANDSGTSTDSGAHTINSNSSLPGGTNYIGDYYSYPQFTAFMSPTFCSSMLVVKKKTFKIPPGGWFKFKVNTGYHEFDNEWLIKNAGLTAPLKHLRNWTKMIALSWHGELVQKSGDITVTTLAATDFIGYATHSITCKAVPYTRKSVVLKPPVNLDTTSPLTWVPQVRPKGIVQVTTTSTNAQEEG